MDPYYDDYEARSRDRANNWKLGMRYPPPAGPHPPRISGMRNNDFGRPSRDNYAFQERHQFRNYERYHYYNPDRHSYMSQLHQGDSSYKNYREPYHINNEIIQNYFAYDNLGDNEHNFSAPSHRNMPGFKAIMPQKLAVSGNCPNENLIDVFHKNKDQQTVISKVNERCPEKKIPQVNPEAAKKEALAAELRKSLRKFQKTHSQNGSKLLVIDKSNESNKAESTNEPQTCFPWDLPLTVDDLKCIGRGKTGNIEVCADSCSENELNSLEKQNFHNSEVTGESANDISPEIQVIKQCRKRKVSESIELVNKKKVTVNPKSRRRHRSASPNLCEETDADNVEGNNLKVIGNNAVPSVSDEPVAETSKAETPIRPRQKSSLMQLLGVRRREFSEMVDQPRNPRVQFMLGLLMKRHKELLIQRAIRSRFSAVGEESEVECDPKEINADQLLTETQNSGSPILENMGASDTIDQLSNILLESSLTVDISSLPQELLDQLGSFLEMGVDFSNFTDEIADAGEVALDSEIEVGQIQQNVIDRLNLSSSTPGIDAMPCTNSLFNEANGGREVSNVDRKEKFRNRTVGKRSSPKRLSPQTRGKTKVTEESSAGEEKHVTPRSTKVHCVKENTVPECNKEQNCNKSNEPSSLCTNGLAREERTRTEVNCNAKENVPLEPEFRIVNIGSQADFWEVNESKSENLVDPENSSRNVNMDNNQLSVTIENSVSKVSLENYLSITPPSNSMDEEETEEKLLSKMWEIDKEIGKLMEKKQELYHKLNLVRRLKISSHSSVSMASQESMQKSTVGQSECRNINVSGIDTMVESLSNKSSVKGSTSHPSTTDRHFDHRIGMRNKTISFDRCDSDKTEETMGSSEDVEIMEIDCKNVLSNAQCKKGLIMDSNAEETNFGHAKVQSSEIVIHSSEAPDIIQSGVLYFTGHWETVLSITVQKDSLYAACADFSICRYNLGSRKVMKRYYGHSKTITCLHVDERRSFTKIYSGSHDKTLLTFDAKTEKLLKTFKVDEPITCMEQNWGILFIGTKEGSIVRFNIFTSLFIEPTMTSLKSEVMAIQTSKEGPRKVLIVASRDKPIIVRDATSGLLLRSINESATKHTVYTIYAMHGLVYTGSNVFGLTAWNFTNGKCMKQYEDCGAIVAVQIVNGMIYAASYDGNIYIYDCEHSKPKHIIKASNKMLLCLAVKYSKIYVGSLDKKLQVWKSPSKYNEEGKKI